MTAVELKIKEHEAIELLRKYGKLLLIKKHHIEEKSKLLKKIKEIAKELVE